LSALSGHLGEDRYSSRQTDLSRTRQMEKIVTRQEQSEYIGAADDPDLAAGHAERAQPVFERRCGGIPEKRFRV